MPSNALMAFTTFYHFDQDQSSYNKEGFDIRMGNTSVLTRLLFKRKHCVKDTTLVPQFSVTLYPNSVFVIPLSTNRQYTHEIKPSGLPIDKIPTRLGYVIRSSKTRAMHKHGQTYICVSQDAKNDEWKPLREITDDDIETIRTLYYEENTTDEIINYGDVFVSMNEGDYKQPLL